MRLLFLRPSMLLSGFMFPFEAMPVPAQGFGQCPPLTHVLRIVRDILLKGRASATSPARWRRSWWQSFRKRLV